MPVFSVGRVRPIFKGQYATANTYGALERVLYNNNLYESVQDVPINALPSDGDTTYWVKISAAGLPGKDGKKGEDGKDGEPGPRGEPGAKGEPGSQMAISDSVISPDSGVAASSYAVMIANNNAIAADVKAIEADAKAVAAGAKAAEADAKAQNALANIETAIPRGIISMWSGDIQDIPSGWQLCNGQNGAPNLTDRFIVGAGGTYVMNSQGGATTHGHGVTVSGTTLTTSHIPWHSHSVELLVDGKTLPGNTSFLMYGGNGTSLVKMRSTSTGGVGGSQAHGHSAVTAAASSMPPFYALAYIMKL